MANQTQQQSTGNLYNALTAGSKIIGTVIADSDIRIDGVIEGELQCSGKVVIGEKGMLKGNVACTNAEILGKLDGKINVRQSLALRSTGNIKGEVKTQTLIVEPNAVFNGTCSMGETAQPQPAQPKK
ncbi:MAG: polymer-forming cytoskeletal protein [Paludibacteraceae bacterium]|nr:polymer-forming cytoskeletal protein [Paludibacteraceae bacterium]